MEDDKPLFEIDQDAETPDPDETPIKDRKYLRNRMTSPSNR
ncbi:hypothetical protein [Rhizobium sp. PEPV16]|nr:hypothetical protein [Rhizobium sp. PEPV16]